MTGVWKCALCETVNQGTRTCGACGATMSRSSEAFTRVRSRVSPVPALPDPATPLADPVRRAINREPVDEEEWPYERNAFRVVPVPFGCMVISTPGRRPR